MDKLKVLYIAGSGRSGSTILGNLLGQIEGFVHVGEIYFIWSHGLIHNHLCGCGLPVQECAMWKDVFDDAYGGLDQVNPQDMIGRYKQYVGSRHQPPPLTLAKNRLRTKDAEDYIASLRELYQAIQSVNEAKVIVDGSKLHTQLLALSMMKDIELHMLHLVRDPRGVVFSWQRKKRYIGVGKREFMDRFGAWRSSFKWNVRNIYVSVVARQSAIQYHLLRYEDFIENPRAAICQILEWIDEKSDLLFISDQKKVELSVPQHAIHGNPVRLQAVKKVTLRVDDEWKTGLETKDKVLATLLTLPLLRKYGYEVGLFGSR
ncbi:MAG: sulfotransferase domain-containing protein [Candidatus Promineifilaceae bacterium]